MNRSTIRIAITGPESTGKSTLAAQLARHYNTLWVPEYARTHLELLNRPYTANDILLIAQRQLQAEEETAATTQLLFADTEMIVIKIWYEHFYGPCPNWINQAIARNPYRHYLLTFTDLPWIDDPQREHPHLRNHFFNLFLQQVQQTGKPYTIITGNNRQRFNNAVAVIDQLL